MAIENILAAVGVRLDYSTPFSAVEQIVDMLAEQGADIAVKRERDDDTRKMGVKFTNADGSAHLSGLLLRRSWAMRWLDGYVAGRAEGDRKAKT